MKTYEELKAMTTEDLVRFAMEMQDELEAKSDKLERIAEKFSALENEAFRFNRVLKDTFLESEL